ncbi:sulfite exporter TauE/SafE family protein [Ancylobacter sp. 6x-1]|uniref:Probable membrane transporter protein n=1 Tax=Ancylobacter crimeensis TaxID=2579147 RepID=A0ABT0DEF0_9HYPH|nr:sulfite exporter TauE/SafE family protein [Ancylobacter crimeensis]MCK0198326.1 sulfite exporter TauE/SafE family protein [Ancylobacter crimeensis]
MSLDVMPLDFALIWAATASLIAGITRGFSGFGGALIFVPLVSAAFGPEVAVPALLIVDTAMTAPIVTRALPRCTWGEVAPLGIGAVLTVPLGVALLKQMDPTTLRWCLSGLALALLALLVSGWRHSGQVRWWGSLVVGAAAGVFGGAAQMSGPVVVAYWLGSRHNATQVRLNLFGFFFIATLASALAYALGGLFTWQVLKLSLLLGPLYAAGLWLGSHAFARASDRHYRIAAYVVIGAAAFGSLPLFDALLRH